MYSCSGAVSRKTKERQQINFNYFTSCNAYLALLRQNFMMAISVSHDYNKLIYLLQRMPHSNCACMQSKLELAGPETTLVDRPRSPRLSLITGLVRCRWPACNQQGARAAAAAAVAANCSSSNYGRARLCVRATCYYHIIKIQQGKEAGGRRWEEGGKRKNQERQ